MRLHVGRLEPDHPSRLPSRRKPVWSDEPRRFWRRPDAGKGLVVAGARRTVLSWRLPRRRRRDGRRAAGDCGFKATRSRLRPMGKATALAAKPLWSHSGAKGKAFVDYQNDVTDKDLELAVREGYGHVEHAKRYTTNGMATDQGKLSNINAIGIWPSSGVSPAESAPRPSGRPIRRSPSAR
jgi:hypothetical protein